MKPLAIMVVLLGACGGALQLGGNPTDGGADAKLASVDGASDLATSGVHQAGDSCDDGVACSTGLVCKAVGDPCGSFPNCKVCYVPCDSGAATPQCAVGQTCMAPIGQGGDVCIGKPCTLTSAQPVSCTAGSTTCGQYNAYCSSWDQSICACNGQLCTPGQDQSCNFDPASSAIAGHCRPDSLCDCGNRLKDPVTGKCK